MSDTTYFKETENWYLIDQKFIMKKIKKDEESKSKINTEIYLKKEKN